MLKAMRVYKEVGYDGMMMPDHVPRVDGDRQHQGFAFAFGYIKALIAAVAAESGVSAVTPGSRLRIRLRSGARQCHRVSGPTICSQAENT